MATSADLPAYLMIHWLGGKTRGMKREKGRARKDIFPCCVDDFSHKIKNSTQHLRTESKRQITTYLHRGIAECRENV
jgi:hypothetical protein